MLLHTILLLNDYTECSLMLVDYLQAVSGKYIPLWLCNELLLHGSRVFLYVPIFSFVACQTEGLRRFLASLFSESSRQQFPLTNLRTIKKIFSPSFFFISLGTCEIVIVSVPHNHSFSALSFISHFRDFLKYCERSKFLVNTI